MTSPSTVSITPDEIVYFLKKDIRYKGVSHQILYQRIIERAAREREVNVTDDEIQAEADRLRLTNRLEKAADTLAWLAEQMITPEDWEAGIRDRLLTKKLAERLFSGDIEKIFAQNKLDYERVLLYQIQVSYERVAHELFYQIEEEEISFYEAAHLYDLDERRRYQCGYEGTVYRWSLKPDVAAAVFSANPGEMIFPLKTDQGYHLFLPEEFIAAELTEEISQEILNKMFQQWLAGELNYLLHNQTG
jgi:parvulin-like peptidyl-prolyl isomerase